MVGNHCNLNSNVLYFSSVKTKRKKMKRKIDSSLKYGMKRKLNTDIQL